MIDLSKLPTVPGKLTRVSVSPSLQVSYRQSPSEAVLRSTGRTLLNTSATQDLTELAKAAGKQKGEFAILPAANEEAGFVAFYVVEPGTLGSIAAKPIDGGKRASIDLSAIYELFPSLRANVTRACTVKIMKDEEDEACLVMAVKGSVIKTPTRRPSSQSAPAAE